MVGASTEFTKMTVLICGASGRLGRAMARDWSSETQVIAPTREELDLTSRDEIRALLGGNKFSLIINCAAWTDVDGCENNPELARQINSEFPGYLRESCDGTRTHLMHVSTDFVFDGETTEPYGENDLTNPISVYGKTKLDGEIAAGPEATIIRTSWLQSSDSHNMLNWILERLDNPGVLEVPSDRQANLTFVEDLLPVFKYLASQRYEGVVHATNSGTTRWSDFARFVAEESGNDPSRILALNKVATPQVAPRPPFSALDNLVLRYENIEPVRHYKDAVREKLNQV